MSAFDKPLGDGKPREIIPEGKHVGLLYSVVDLGSRNDTYQGETRVKHEVHLTWEFPEVLMSDGRPFVYGATYTMTDGKFGPYFAKTSNIFKMLRGWTGLGDKICSKVGILGKLIQDDIACVISIAHEPSKKDPSKTYAVAESIKPHRGKEAPKRVNRIKTYSIDMDVLPEGIPEWQIKRIAESLEKTTGVPKRQDTPGHMVQESDMDCPF